MLKAMKLVHLAADAISRCDITILGEHLQRLVWQRRFAKVVRQLTEHPRFRDPNTAMCAWLDNATHLDIVWLRVACVTWLRWRNSLSDLEAAWVACVGAAYETSRLWSAHEARPAWDTSTQRPTSQLCGDGHKYTTRLAHRQFCPTTGKVQVMSMLTSLMTGGWEPYLRGNDGGIQLDNLSAVMRAMDAVRSPSELMLLMRKLIPAKVFVILGGTFTPFSDPDAHDNLMFMQSLRHAWKPASWPDKPIFSDADAAELAQRFEEFYKSSSKT